MTEKPDYFVQPDHIALPTLPPALSLRIEVVQVRNPCGIFSEAGREKLAEMIVSGNGRIYSRSEIKARIVKVARRLAKRIEEGKYGD